MLADAQHPPGRLNFSLTCLRIGSSYEVLEWLLPSFFTQNAILPPDIVEELLARESNFEEDCRLPRLRLLAREYKRFKDRSARAVHQYTLFERVLSSGSAGNVDKTFSCDGLLSHWSFVSPGNAAALALYRDNNNNIKARTQLKDTDTVSDWACRIARKLQSKNPNSLQLVTLVEEPNRDDLSTVFSFRHYTAATINGRLKKLHLLPTWVMEVVLAQTWGIELMPWSPSSGPQNCHEFARPEPLLPPSMRTSDSWTSQFLMKHSSRIHWGKNPNRQGNLDPTRGNNEIFLIWQSGCTSFVSDLAVHIFEHHKSIPSSESAKIIVRPPANKTEEFRIVITFRSCRAHALFTNRRNNAVDPEIEASIRNGLERRWSPVKEAILSLCCLFEVVVTDTAEFVRDCHSETSRIHIIGRKSPSTSKLRFLFHLEDLCQAAQAGVQHAWEVLDLLARWMSHEGCDETSIDSKVFHDKLEIIKKDLEFLNQELTELKLNIEKDQKILRDHFELEQSSTVFRLSVLAAIFLPLSFTTSLFGMNIDQSVREGPQGFTNYTNTTLDGVSPDIRNSTEALISMIGVNANLSFTWLTFGITAASLLVTLPLSLFVGAIVRTIVVSAAKYVAYWRVIAVIAGTAFIAFSIGSSQILYPGAIIINVPLILVFAWNTYRAWILSQRPLMWTSVTFVTTASFFVDLFQDTFYNIYQFQAHFPWMVLPWLYIGLLYLIPWWRKRR
ncbi:hypothetical protein GGS24DRAFT_504627 [Hypoxylon argillaceum]|nr:hypothetical protein GGS24DRAFT_504627 [Hypoxylon argillaceum]